MLFACLHIPPEDASSLRTRVFKLGGQERLPLLCGIDQMACTGAVDKAGSGQSDRRSSLSTRPFLQMPLPVL